MEEEKAALSPLSADRIYTVTKRKETLVLQVRVLEESRKTLLRNLARSYGIVEEPSLDLMIRCFPRSEGERLLELRRRLREQVARLCRHSEENRLAMDSSRQWISLAINLLRNLGADGTSPGTYGTRGEVTGDVRGRILNRHAV